MDGVYHTKNCLGPLIGLGLCQSLACIILIGERAVRDILKQARSVGMAGSDPRIEKVCTELDQLMDNLSSLRARGMVCTVRNCFSYSLIHFIQIQITSFSCMIEIKWIG